MSATKPSAPAPAPTTAPTHSSNGAATEPSEPAEWTESQYISALALLESLQTRVDSLRQTVPTLVHTLATPHPTPEALFREFQKHTLGPSKALLGLKKAFEDRETKEVLERARWGFARKVSLPEGMGEFLKEVERFGWVEQAEEAKSRKRKLDEMQAEEEDGGKVYTDEEMEDLVKAYGEKHEHVKSAEWNKDDQSITVSLLSTGSTQSTDTVNRSKSTPQPEASPSPYPAPQKSKQGARPSTPSKAQPAKKV
jgi:hypothetical protein